MQVHLRNGSGHFACIFTVTGDFYPFLPIVPLTAEQFRAEKLGKVTNHSLRLTKSVDEAKS
ncbi:UNVERIFIED_CONTAM: hypothetical protein NY603_32385, partial [Bacteroidetes bacterium 56_B9]